MAGRARATRHSRVVTVVNQRGLHARAAAKFVQCVGRFKADITVTKDGTRVSGLSIMGLMMLAAAQGSRLTISARGAEAAAALEALADLVADKFGEE
jgi:phosphocarrier protein